MTTKNNRFIRTVATIGISAVIGLSTITIGHTPKAEAATASVANKIISIGDNYLGVPYRFGAPVGITYVFDCSSFTQYVFKKIGVSLPRTSKAQASRGSYVSRANLKKGDLVFFSTARTGKSIGHVAIYAGNNRILHTYGSGGVRFSNLNSSHWSSHYITARRVK
ncbi:C40 family peptidase [Paenibacillus oenotherae]|uniref:C40 family peptidase n=1 Tax=Paenibacillus oenotherae TaxID=1435645 RepID=A0ABS7DCX6_9BACL|nr:C40 family peptidase [Paenibacillus oenotherae]MBW7477594.1 C40 family peptidase [Paenibacillus oenotherae]